MKKPLGLVVALIALTGCDAKDPFANSAGTYWGFIERAAPAQQTASHDVSAEATKYDKNTLQIRVDQGNLRSYFFIRAKSSKSIELFPPKSLARWTGDKLTFVRTSNDCFGPEDDPTSTNNQICRGERELAIDLTMGKEHFSLVLARMVANAIPAFEKPERYAVGDLLQRTLQKNFETRVQFKKVVEARARSENAWGSLAPHTNVGGALTFIPALSISSATRLVGDLLPFLFPTRWSFAKSAEWKSRAEFYAWVLTKADAANIVEGMAYSVSRDGQLVGDLTGLLTQTKELQALLEDRKRFFLIRSDGGAVEKVKSTANTIEKALSKAEDAYQIEKKNLAHAAGFQNPDAILSVAPVEGVTVDDSWIPEEASARVTAYRNSYELLQIVALTEAARADASSRQFAWMDPSGDRAGDLGLGFNAYLSMGQAQLDELLETRRGLESLLNGKISITLETLRKTVKEHRLAQKGVEIQNELVQGFLDQVRFGTGMPITDLVLAIQNQVQARLDLIAAEHAYYIAVANLNRVLYAGPYAALSIDHVRAPWITSHPITNN